jgi:hypothetical protein
MVAQVHQLAVAVAEALVQLEEQMEEETDY